MPRARPILIALIALFLSACSTGTPPDASLDGPTTTLTLATSGSGVGTLGVPFDKGSPVVTSVSVEIVALDVGPDPLTFSLQGDVYRYDPEGALSAVQFAFTEGATVTLPAGNEYTFISRGEDVGAVWMAYGVTVASVFAATTGVTLGLETMIDDAALDGALTVIARGQSIDLTLDVMSPGGYAVPTSDYEVVYTVASADGTVTVESKLGARVVAHLMPVDADFTVTATISGLRAGENGSATWGNDVTSVFTIPFTVPTGFGFDTEAPTVSIDSIAPGTVGVPITVSGLAEDDVAIARVEVYVGPALAASSVVGATASDVVLGAGTWSVDLAPVEAGTYTVIVLAIDTAGNEERASAIIQVVEPTVITFVHSTSGSATVAAGESVILTGPVFDGFDPGLTTFELYPMDGSTVPISNAGLTVANGTWTLPWITPSMGHYDIQYIYNSAPAIYASIGLTVQ